MKIPERPLLYVAGMFIRIQILRYIFIKLGYPIYESYYFKQKRIFSLEELEKEWKNK